jgi:stage V sporulation protein B
MADPGPTTNPNHSTRTFGRDVATLSTVRFAAAGAGFLTSILAAHLLGPAPVGIAGVGMTGGTIAALIANGGLNISSIYFLGRRPADRQAIVSVSFTLGLIAATIAAALAILGAPVVAPDVFRGADLPLLAATGLLGASIVGFEVTGSLLLGSDLRSAYLVAQVIEGIGSFLLAVIVLVLLSRTAAGFVLSTALAFLAAVVFASWTLQRSLRRPILAFDGRFARESLALGLRGQIGNVLQFLNLRLDVLFVPIFVDLRAVGIYVIAVRMSEVVSQVASAAAVFLFPAVSREDVDRTELTERAMRAMLTVVAVTGLLIAVPARPLLALFFGTEFESGSAALQITMLAMIPLAITRLLAGDMKGRGRPGLVSLSAGTALIATVVLDLTLIPRFGIEGAALASFLAYSVGAIVIVLAYRRTTGASVREFVPRLDDVRWLVARGRAIRIPRARPGRPPAD